MTRSSQSGAVFLYILLAIAIIASLTAIVSRGSRTSESTLTTEKTKIAAQEIIDYGNAVAAAVQKLRLRGCADTHISFEHTALGADHVNPNTTDDRCKIFNTSGGNLSLLSPPEDWLDSAWEESAAYGKVAFVQNCINLVGTSDSPCPDTATDLIFKIGFLREEICQAINTLVNIADGDIPEADTSLAPFQGTYVSGALLSHSDTDGKMSACIKDTAGSTAGQFRYHQILLAR